MRLLLLAPWLRGPWLLTRRPGVAFALLVAAAIAVLPVAGAALFLSSASSAAVATRMAPICPWDGGVQLSTNFPRDGGPGELISKPPGDLTELHGPVETVFGAGHIRKDQDRRRHQVWLVARDGFRDHLDVLAGGTGPGAWLPDGLAKRLGVGPGDEIRVGAEPMPVAAIYRDLKTVSDPEYWCSLRKLYRAPPFAETPVYPLVMVDRAEPAQGRRFLEWRPPATGLTLPRMRAAEAEAGRIRAALPEGTAEVDFASRLGRVVRRGELVRSALTGSVLPLVAAGALLGLGVVAAAGMFWVDRRRTELALLAARGAPPWSLGVKAQLESLPALLLGAGTGWTAAAVLVRVAGPSPVIDATAWAPSVLAAGGMLIASIVLIGVSAAVGCRGLWDVHHRRTWRPGAIPWEIACFAAAAAVWLTSEPPRGEAVVMPPSLLLVPLLLVAGLTVVTARIAARLPDGPADGPADGPLTGWRLGVRRTARGRGRSIAVGAATAAVVGVVLYGGAATQSMQRTIEAQARMVTGSDVVVNLERRARLPAPLAGRASVVATTSTTIDGIRTEVIGVDPATFHRGARWDEAIPGPHLHDAVARLTDAAPAPALFADFPRRPANPRLGDRQLHLEEMPALPGANGRPVLFVHRAVVESQASRPWYEIWMRGDPAPLGSLPVSFVGEASEVYGKSTFEPVTYTFQFLIALCGLVALVTVAGIILTAEARTPARRRAYVILRRIGLPPRGHLLALLVEAGLPIAAGLTAGTAMAAACTAFVGGRFDLDPDTPPTALLGWPWWLTVLIPVLATVTVLLTALLAQVRIQRARPAEVLRDVE